MYKQPGGDGGDGGDRRGGGRRGTDNEGLVGADDRVSIRCVC